MISRDEALKAVDDIFNYCEEIDYSLPENERSGYKMLPDIQKIRKYIIDNTRPHGEWIIVEDCEHFIAKCSVCGRIEDSRMVKNYPFCRCGADMRKGEDVE